MILIKILLGVATGAASILAIANTAQAVELASGKIEFFSENDAFAGLGSGTFEFDRDRNFAEFGFENAFALTKLQITTTLGVEYLLEDVVSSSRLGALEPAFFEDLNILGRVAAEVIGENLEGLVYDISVAYLYWDERGSERFFRNNLYLGGNTYSTGTGFFSTDDGIQDNGIYVARTTSVPEPASIFGQLAVLSVGCLTFAAKSRSPQK